MPVYNLREMSIEKDAVYAKNIVTFVRNNTWFYAKGKIYANGGYMDMPVKG